MSASNTTAYKNNEQYLSARHRTAGLWKALFTLAVTTAVIALVVLLFSIINQSFGYVIVENNVAPETLAAQPLESLPPDALIAILRENLTKNRLRTIERDGLPLVERSQQDLLDTVIASVVQPRVVKSYNLDRSLLEAAAIRTEAARDFPGGRLEFRSWISGYFITHAMAPTPELAGVRTALLGSIFLILITITFAFPVGVGAAIYLEEYADNRSRINRIIQTNIENLAGVPSIVYGILGLAIFVRAIEPVTSGAVFGVGDSSGRTILSAGLTMGLLILPILIINAQEAIRATPNSLREASYGLGATRWQTIWSHVLPYALPGILTGTILAISRALGETAPLIVVGASTMITKDPSGVFSRFTALPIQIYNWTTRPQDEFRHIAAAAILVLLITLLSLNAFAILLRNHFRRRNT